MEYFVTHDDVELFVRDVGEGPVVVLLHGWPDTSVLWDDVVAELTADGWRCVAVDLRGCGRSSKPADVERYAMRELVGDVAAVIEALDVGPVALMGHDWGANLTWATSIFRPDLVSAMIALSVGHPTAFRSAGLEQQLKSWYTLLFAHEGLGEAFLRKNDYEAMRTWLGHPRVDAVIDELERDGQMRTHLLWYRANIPPSAFVDDPPRLAPVRVPALGLWSSGDRALSERQMRDSGSYCAAGFEFVRLEGFAHWLPIEAPREVAHEVKSFLRRRGFSR
ncbi:MAG: alpha/beta fold hydrolase [Acidobacteriota bacterium]|nr:alpha/beta fold hydrolase [Acidobacteriota bacterium]